MRKTLTNKARQLRKQATQAEQKLWTALRQQAACSKIKFRRQQPIGIYVADFYCAEYRCAIEIDGSSHDLRQKKDAQRDSYMRAKGLRVLRFTEADTAKNPAMVVATIYRELKIPLTKKNQAFSQS